MRYILAHDVGTTGNKATLYDAEGTLVKSTFAPYSTAFPYATSAEQNLQDWWQSLCLSTKRLLHESRVEAADVVCVVFSGQMMGMVAVDIRGQPVRQRDHLGVPGQPVTGPRLHRRERARKAGDPTYPAIPMTWRRMNAL